MESGEGSIPKGTISQGLRLTALPSEVELEDVSCYFVCFVYFVDRYYAAKKTIHELHE